MGKRTPTTPVSAHHRLMRAIVGTSLTKGGYKPTPDDLDLCSRVFKIAGGSWERVFKGSVKDMALLKATLKVAGTQGYLSKTPKWG